MGPGQLADTILPISARRGWTARARAREAGAKPRRRAVFANRPPGESPRAPPHRIGQRQLAVARADGARIAAFGSVARGGVESLATGGIRIGRPRAGPLADALMRTARASPLCRTGDRAWLAPPCEPSRVAQRSPQWVSPGASEPAIMAVGHRRFPRHDSAEVSPRCGTAA